MKPSIPAVCLSALAALLFVCALVFTYAAWHSLFFLGDVTVPEGSVVYSVRGVLTGQIPLYHDYSVPPYTATPYAPLFYLASALLAWGTTQSVSVIYICCRLLTFVATFGAAFFVQKIVLLLKPEAYPARYVAFLLPFSILTLVAWGFAARPDMLATMLSLAGMYAYLRNPRSFAGLFCCAVILALSWWCKQSFIAAPAALSATLLWVKDWRRLGLFLSAYIAALALLAGSTQYLSHGWFYKNIVTANITGLDPGQVCWLTVYGYLYLAPFVTGSALLACAVYFRDILRGSRLGCIALFLLASVTLNMAACMKDGAYFNYMIEPLFIASILAVLGMLRLLQRPLTAVAAPLLLLASLAFSYHSYWYYDGALENALSGDIAGENRTIRIIIEKMNALGGDVLTSISALAVRSDKPVLGTDLFNVRYMEQEGKLSTQAMAERIRRQELAAIVAPSACQPSTPTCSFWPRRMREAILEKYEPRETLYGKVFWYPKKPGS